MRIFKTNIILFCLVLILAASATEAWAVWRVLLDERFDRDPEAHTWPWITNNNPNVMRWHHNAQNWPQGELDSSITWGWQDTVYSARLYPNARFRGAIWCALCDSLGPDTARSPLEDDYVHNQNAWTWWGPFSTEGWISGALSFWMLMDLRHYAGDSLSVAIIDNPLLLTSSREEFHDNCAIGMTIVRGTYGNWQFRHFYLDSLMLNGERVNYINHEDSLWLAFVWQSDAHVIAGKGAFIDDVVLTFDDGLFDIHPRRAYFGYPVNEDSISWQEEIPCIDEEVGFRLDWQVEGSGETPQFDIECYLDDELIYSESRSVEADDRTIYTTIADTIWRVPEGEHTLRWELDTPLDEGGQVEEADEDNNRMLIEFPAPVPPDITFRILTPEQDSVEVWESVYDIRYEILVDSAVIDTTINIYLYWTEDTSGIAANPDTIMDYQWLMTMLRVPPGDGYVSLDIGLDIRFGILEEGMVIRIVGVTSDQRPGRPTLAFSPGTIWIHRPDAVSDDGVTVTGDFGLYDFYPNPFNREIAIDYILPSACNVKIAIYNTSGRLISNLLTGYMTAGRHKMNWQSSGLSAGLYIVALQAGGNADLRKVIYMP